MRGSYIPFHDGYGIVGYNYRCPECDYITTLTDCETGCSKCGFSEPYVDPDEWFEEEIKKPSEEWAWNKI